MTSAKIGHDLTSNFGLLMATILVGDISYRVIAFWSSGSDYPRCPGFAEKCSRRMLSICRFGRYTSLESSYDVLHVCTRQRSRPRKAQKQPESLISREGLKKLGVCIRQSLKLVAIHIQHKILISIRDGNLEHHFPEVTGTNENCQMICHSHLVHANTAAQHPTACHIPEAATSRPSVVGDPERLDSLFCRVGALKKMDDYIRDDVSFLEKTLVDYCVVFPHCDGRDECGSIPQRLDADPSRPCLRNQAFT